MLAEIFKNMYELRAKKCRLRERYINIRRSLPSDMKKERDNKICSFLLSLASYRYSDVKMCIRDRYSTEYEIGTRA